MAEEDSIWHYFIELTNDFVKCKSCEWNQKREKTKSTTNMNRHLKNHHKEFYAQYVKAKEKKKQLAEKALSTMPKITNFTTSNCPTNSESTSTGLVDLVIKRSRVDSGSQPTIIETFTQWREGGSKAQRTDELIMEMIALDLMPLRTPEKTGFKRLINFLAPPQYKLKGRTYFTQKQLPNVYNKLYEYVQNELNMQNHLSFTTDIWTTPHSTFSVISLTAHYICFNPKLNEFVPNYRMIGAQKMNKNHTGEKIKEGLEKMIERMGIEKTKMHCVLRDAASSMKLGLNLFAVDSFDCFLHKIQLAVNEGLKYYADFQQKTIENMKKVIRKIRKSVLQREYINQLQSELEIEENMLIKHCEVRWGSMFKMCESFLKNKEAIKIFMDRDASGKRMEAFTEIEWETIKLVQDILKPAFDITEEMQSRRVTIASVVPFYRALINRLKKSNIALSKQIAESLEMRMSGYELKRKLIIPTILDPNYKLKFFDRDQRDLYKKWLMDELSENVIDLPQNQTNRERTPSISHQTGGSALLEEYLNDNSHEDDLFLFIDKDEADLIKQEIDAYLSEPLQKKDCFKYWTQKAEQWPRLCKLFRQFNCAPVGSQESERLFSTAGAIMTDLRNRLSAENLEKLLFIHENLPLTNFEY